MSDLYNTAKDVKKVTPATDNQATSNKIAKNETTQKTKNEQLQEAKMKINNIFGPASAIQRIKNFDILEKLIEKYKFLKDKQDDLTSFMVSRDGLKEKLTIQGDNGKIFEINNTAIIEEILNICLTKLDSMVEESETTIISFQI